jgi:hypothetical protein
MSLQSLHGCIPFLDTCANRYLVLAVLSSVEGLKVRVTDMNNSEYDSQKRKK